MAKNQKAVKLKNYHLQYILGLLELPLHGADARKRNQFVALLRAPLLAIDDERAKIMKEYAEKDEKGEPKIKEGNVYDLTPENMQKANKEYLDLLNEDFVLDVLPSTQPIIEEAKKLLANTTREMDMREGALYDEVMSAFE